MGGSPFARSASDDASSEGPNPYSPPRQEVEARASWDSSPGLVARSFAIILFVSALFCSAIALFGIALIVDAQVMVEEDVYGLALVVPIAVGWTLSARSFWTGKPHGWRYFLAAPAVFICVAFIASLLEP